MLKAINHNRLEATCLVLLHNNTLRLQGITENKIQTTIGESLRKTYRDN